MLVWAHNSLGLACREGKAQSPLRFQRGEEKDEKGLQVEGRLVQGRGEGYWRLARRQ